MEDVSRLMGHSSTRVTQDIHIHVRNDVYDRFLKRRRDGRRPIRRGGG
jgi:hypothetical protein